MSCSFRLSAPVNHYAILGHVLKIIPLPIFNWQVMGKQIIRQRQMISCSSAVIFAISALEVKSSFRVWGLIEGSGNLDVSILSLCISCPCTPASHPTVPFESLGSQYDFFILIKATFLIGGSP
jgi:hypothetical protein